MARSLAHRGPDYWGLKFVGGSVVGMVRLSVFDDLDYKVPFEYKNSVTAYNGEIYNLGELRSHSAGLHDGDGGLFASLIDSQGPKVIKSIEGMFAFASLRKDGSSLLIGRDKCGEKPLYYRDLGSRVVFASEIKGVVAEALGPEEYPLIASSDSYNFFESYCLDDTEFHGIKQVPPGSIVSFTKQPGCKEATYWELKTDFDPLKREDLSLGLSALKQTEFNEQLRRSIEIRLPGSRPYALLLSGGVDSSLLAACSKPKYCVTGQYELQGYSEGTLPATVARYIGAEQSVISPKKADFEAHIEEIIWYCDGPVTWTAFNLYMMFKEVARLGMRVCLTGEGADEAFLGYARHLIYKNAWDIDSSILWPQYEELIYKGYEGRPELYLKLTNRGSEGDNPERILKHYRNVFESMNNKIESLTVIDFYTTMQILLRMLDRMSMRWGVEARAPFLDSRVLGLALNLPVAMKIENFIGKKIVRNYPVPVDFPSLKEIRKKGFAVPYNNWFGGSGYTRKNFSNQAWSIFKSQFSSYGLFTQSLDRFSQGLPECVG